MERATRVEFLKLKAASIKNRAKDVMEKDGIELSQFMEMLRDQISDECVTLTEQMAKVQELYKDRAPEILRNMMRFRIHRMVSRSRSHHGVDLWLNRKVTWVQKCQCCNVTLQGNRFATKSPVGWIHYECKRDVIRMLEAAEMDENDLLKYIAECSAKRAAAKASQLQIDKERMDIGDKPMYNAETYVKAEYEKTVGAYRNLRRSEGNGAGSSGDGMMGYPPIHQATASLRLARGMKEAMKRDDIDTVIVGVQNQTHLAEIKAVREAKIQQMKEHLRMQKAKMNMAQTGMREVILGKWIALMANFLNAVREYKVTESYKELMALTLAEYSEKEKEIVRGWNDGNPTADQMAGKPQLDPRVQMSMLEQLQRTTADPEFQRAAGQMFVMNGQGGMTTPGSMAGSWQAVSMPEIPPDSDSDDSMPGL